MISKDEKELIRKEFINDLYRQGTFDDMATMFQDKLKARLKAVYLSSDLHTRDQVLDFLNAICLGFYACWDTHFMLVQLAKGYNEGG